MTSLSVRAPVLPRVKFGGLGRLFGVAMAALDVWIDAQQLADEAWRRFPYARS
jgi:hypothetical protein